MFKLKRKHSLSFELAPYQSAITNGAATSKKLPPGLKKPGLRFNLEGAGGDSVTGSLEDLVNSFDEKLSQCFRDYQEQVENIAPVQVRFQAFMQK